MLISIVVPTLGLLASSTSNLIRSFDVIEGFSYEVHLVNQSSKCIWFDSVRKHVHEHCVDWKGTSRARNFGAANAQGEYIVFLDDDVVFDFSSLREAIRFLEVNREYAGLVGRALALSGETQSNVGRGGVSSREIFVSSLNGACLESAMIFRRSDFLNFGFNEKLGGGNLFASCEGRDLLRRMLKGGCRLFYYPDYFIRHSNLPDSDVFSRRRYFSHGLGIGGYFLYSLEFRYLFEELLKNILASVVYLYRFNRSKKYLLKFLGIVAALLIGG